MDNKQIVSVKTKRYAIQYNTIQYNTILYLMRDTLITPIVLFLVAL